MEHSVDRGVSLRKPVADPSGSGGPIAAQVRSDLCRWDELCVPYRVDSDSRRELDLGADWVRVWTSTWLVGCNEIVRSVLDVDQVPFAEVRPMRRFSYGTAQRHRPGLGYMVSTERLHGGESLEEHRVLLALDFAGDVLELLSQPFRLAYHAGGRVREHIPDYLAITRFGPWLIDVRPGRLVKAQDRVAFAASGEFARASGWHYTVVTGWLPQVFTTLDDLSQRRRECGDMLGLRPALMQLSAGGPLPFGELVGLLPLPAVARAQAIRLLWLRRLGMDLTEPLTDQAIVWSAEGQQA